jgi:glutathione gamma-glutamylcysteinyltransferase
MNLESTVYRRPLPPALIPFSSEAGRQLFRDALDAGQLEAFFPLIEQFHTQSDPAFCGLGSLVMVLNALGVDPGRVWRGPWRWFSEELLDCCTPLAKVQVQGLTIEEVACLARCNGAEVELGSPDAASLAEFRAAVEASTRSRERMLIASYCRSTLGQTGAGHYSPIGGYHAGSDQVLLLDVARFKYPPHWVPVPLMYEAMRDCDPQTGRPRGWLMLAKRATSSAVARFLVCSDGIATSALVQRALALSAEALGTRPGAGLDEVLRVTSQALVESGLTERVRTRAPESAEQRALYAELEASFRQLPLYVRAARGLDAPSAAAVTLWWLALAPVALRAVPAAAEVELAPLLDRALVPALLATEIELLRSQVQFLLDRPGACRAG